MRDALLITVFSEIAREDVPVRVRGTIVRIQADQTGIPSIPEIPKQKEQPKHRVRNLFLQLPRGYSPLVFSTQFTPHPLIETRERKYQYALEGP